MLRLGGRTMGTDNAREFSSAAKGETLEDTIRIVSGYADVIVLRHNEEGAAKRAAAVSSVPIINAGDGPGQHPTQALLDLYTIKDELNRIDGIRVAMVGDLANGRTVRSLTYLLSKFKDIQIWFVAPPQVGDARRHQGAPRRAPRPVDRDRGPGFGPARGRRRLPDDESRRSGSPIPRPTRRVKGIYRIDNRSLDLMRQVRDRDAPAAARGRDRAGGRRRPSRRLLPPGAQRPARPHGAARPACCA